MLRRCQGSVERSSQGRNAGAYGLTLTGGRPCTVGRLKAGGPAFIAGLRTGDVICRVNGHCVLSASTDNVARILRYQLYVVQLENYVGPVPTYYAAVHVAIRQHLLVLYVN